MNFKINIVTKKVKLEISNLNFSNGERIIFRDLQLQAFSRDKIVIVGENGVGKSTLFKIIKGLINNFGGLVKIQGNIGFLPQSFETVSSRSAWEDLD